jgi:hypothetical protein
MRDKDKGEVSELSVVKELIENGYTVSRPLNDTKYDIIAESKGSFVRIQVKRGRTKNGCVRATLCEYTDGEAYIYTEDDIDMFAVHNPKHGCFYIPVEDSPKQLIHIRVEDEEQKHPSINRAVDYRFEEQL